MTTVVNVTESVAPALSETLYVIVYVVSIRTVGSVPRARRVEDVNEIPGGRPDKP